MENETLRTLMNWIQIVVGTLLVLLIRAQVRGQGGGLFGASDGSYRTRRGLEKVMFQLTILLIAIFLTTSIVNVSIF